MVLPLKPTHNSTHTLHWTVSLSNPTTSMNLSSAAIIRNRFLSLSSEMSFTDT